MTTMLNSIKLTVTLPETLRTQAKRMAERSGISISAFTRNALQLYIQNLLEEEDDIQYVEQIEANLASGKTRTYSHSEIWQELDELEKQGALPN